MIDKILRSLDGASKGEAAAALVTLLDFSKAFDRQDATLAVKSFQDNLAWSQVWSQRSAWGIPTRGVTGTVVILIPDQ